MKPTVTITTSLSLLLASAHGAAPSKIPSICRPDTAAVQSVQIIDGRPLTYATCALQDTAVSPRAAGALAARSYDLCGAPCTSYCHAGGGGPDPNDCTSLANEYANNGEFTVAYGTYGWWTWGSCAAGLANSYGSDLVYCYDWNNWAGVVNYLAWNCQGTTGDNGGQCDFNNNPNGLGYVIVETA
ncbi:hypothetical protein PsYK624_136390 [Phanerochaete sordida]|uniref:Uncharacterized protein n=1 Tax=Phanerochaete sordida TaxID=48140 RepID=A0A9P3LJD2_9APHY|nr:hypothetical protein PsYK624_136390 [Phanerochaete sordida]